MTRRLNRRGWYVLISIASDDASQCVDVFEHPDGGYGYQHFRSDPEDQGRWTPLGGIATPDHASPHQAATAAQADIAWLTTHPRAARALADYLS